ncbi:MAG TPA: hypothetical protein PLJ12_04785, partial [Planctomycetota bacterium]|nr:hypothetical protein [Planctomycetota bacterium]
IAPLGPCAPAGAWPWDAEYTPDGAYLYVSLFGGYQGSGGCTVLKLNALTLAPVARLHVGESPEEIVFTLDTGGAVSEMYVTSSSASSVTIFDSSDQVVATVPIPERPGGVFGTAFPFGLAVAPDQATVWVGTGEGRVFAIDVATHSVDLARTLDLGADCGFGRIAFVGNRLALTKTTYHANWMGSTASLVLIDPAVPAAAQEVLLATSPTSALYPSPQDLALDPSGSLYVAGFDMGPQVYVVDPLSATVSATWNTYTQPTAGKFQALGLHGNLLVVADLYSGQIARIDTHTGVMVGHVEAGMLGQGASELSFSPDGATLIMPMGGSDNLVRYWVH